MKDDEVLRGVGGNGGERGPGKGDSVHLLRPCSGAISGVITHAGELEG